MYSLNINNIKPLDDLDVYMLNTLKISSSETIENYNEQNKLKNDKSIIPKSSIYVNYNKLKSKYYEKPIKKNLIFNDKLFWCFYKLYYNVKDTDLEYLNIFSTEKEFKLSVIEKIKQNKDLLKKYKIQKSTVETEITNDKIISLNSFKTLCILYNLNIIVLKDNNTYTRFTNNTLESCIDNLDNYHVIKLNYRNSSTFNSNFEINMNIDKSEIVNALTKFYYVKDLEKPLKSFSSYKLNEIIDIANKLEIQLNRDDGKKKTKIELYSDCLKKIS